MAFIQIEFGGQKTSGGFLKIDGGRQIKLTDGLLIPINAGTHYLSFSNQGSGTRAMTKANAAAGNVKATAAMLSNAIDGDITVELDENDIMFFTVVSDHKGNVLSLPTYTVQELNEEGLKRAEEILADQEVQHTARSRKRRKIWGVIVAIIGILGIIMSTPGLSTDELLAGLLLIAVGVLLFLSGSLKKKKKK